jgi:abortive infection bacteriophage resistance protein
MNLKPATTIEQQIAILQNRGCVVTDEAEAADFLRKVNYYRLTAYLLPFQASKDSYRPGTTFEKVRSVYEFDQQLQALLYSAIGEIELYARTVIAYYHSHKYGADGYLDAANFVPVHKHDIFMRNLTTEIAHNENLPFVRHHIRQYGGVLPIWAAVELFSLGMLSHFYIDMPLEDRKAVAAEFDTKEAYLSNWLRVLTVLRNICAHYGRLYYSKFRHIPKLPKHLELQPTRRLFDQVLTLKLLSPTPAQWNASFLPKLSALIDEYGESISLEDVGFSTDWESVLRSASS